MAKGERGRDKAVKRQYEEYPYPPRAPEDEKSRLIEGSPSYLRELNHYLFGGARDFSKSFKALVAGGGTGDAAIMLAQHLADQAPNARVTYLDLSTASRKVAEARAEVRELINIDFLTGSLLDLPEMGVGPFDYIDCCGVLHHLEEAEAGLAALCSVLADDGGMGLMVYATLGRTGVYPVQNALKALTDEETPARQVNAAKALLKDLPDSNWLKKNALLGDHLMGEDAALFDLLLHPQDRSYLVPELADLVASAHLEVVGFIEPVRYDPETYLTDRDLIKRARELPYLAQAALAENLAGSLKTHSFYVRKVDGCAPGPAKFDPAMIPRLRDNNPGPLGKALSVQEVLTVTFDGAPIKLPIPEGAGEFAGLIDGKRSLGDIQKVLSPNWQAFRRRYGPAYKLLNNL
ncbi:MAG: class I SAM-dependent methyltransferase, partial [Alphaproteobacteria bacterium]